MGNYQPSCCDKASDLPDNVNQGDCADQSKKPKDRRPKNQNQGQGINIATEGKASNDVIRLQR
jgi:hypothetical protein